MKRSKKIAAGVLALTLIANSVGLVSYAAGNFGILPSTAAIAGQSTQQVDLGTFKYATSASLGSANKYAVFSYDYFQRNHMEGIFATQYFYPSGDAFGSTNNITHSIDKGENYIYIGSLDLEDADQLAENMHKITQMNGVTLDYLWKMIVPDEVTIDRTPNNGNGVRLVDPNGNTSGVFNNMSDLAAALYHVSDTTYQIDFDKAFSALKNVSAAYAKENTSGTNTTVTMYNPSDDPNNYKTVIECGEGRNVVNIKAEDLRILSRLVLMSRARAV